MKRYGQFENKHSRLRKIFCTVKDTDTNEWQIMKNDELELLYQEMNIAEAIRKKGDYNGPGMSAETKTRSFV